MAGLGLMVVGLAAPQDPTGPLTPSLPASPAFATADSNGSMIAVTGIDVTGSSLLYVIDTESRQLSVYQATGGGRATSGVRWVGGRRIDLDLRVDGWNDKSELGYKALREQFQKGGVLPADSRRQ